MVGSSAVSLLHACTLQAASGLMHAMLAALLGIIPA
jgi:hypothetical protein